jgi:TorA maturation chaperone TorD
MAYLAEQEALLSDSTIEADKFLVFQYQLLKNHLSRWVDMVCEAILDTSTNPFYELQVRLQLNSSMMQN